MAQRPTNSFTALGGGVPVHYDRKPPQFGLGTQGTPSTWYCTKSFQKKLDKCFSELWEKCPLGKADVICTAGAWVNKPGRHGQGRAFDLDAIFWGDRMVLANNYPNDRIAYLGIESILRKHFGTVLNYEYNTAHRDHWHIDDGSAVAFLTGSTSRVKYLQMVLTHLFTIEQPLTIDGLYGKKTRNAARVVLKELRLANSEQIESDSKLDKRLKQVWVRFLDKAAERGLTILEPVETVHEPSAVELLEDLHRIIKTELGDTESRKRIEAAVTTFVSHPDIDAALTPPG